MAPPTVNDLREACIARGLCGAEAFDEAVREHREAAAAGRVVSLLDTLVQRSVLRRDDALRMRARGFGRVGLESAPARAPSPAAEATSVQPAVRPAAGAAESTIAVARGEDTVAGLAGPAAPPPSATVAFDASDLKAVLGRAAKRDPIAEALSAPAVPRVPEATLTEPPPLPPDVALAPPPPPEPSAPYDDEPPADPLGGSPATSSEAPPEGPVFGQDLPGRTVGGCRIERELGRGAMGVVFEGVHLALQRRVALKVLLPQAHRSQKDVEQFFQEARALARVEHQNIVQVYDVGEQDGLHYIVMQFLEGETLSDRMERVGALPWEEACRVARDAANGLGVAHERGIVHRDVKPENLFLTTDGVVKVADFGLATPASSGADAAGGTEVMGTPSYMSPEQIDGRQVDGRADLYSLGCTLYVLLTGRKPFVGDAPIDILLAQTRDVATPVCRVTPTVPVSLSQVVEKLMAKSPAGRYQKASDLCADLESILGGGKPRIVVEIEDVMGRMQQLMREAEAPRSGFAGRPGLVVAAALVVVATAATVLTMALPAVEVPEVDTSILLAPLPEEVAAERAAREALAAVEAEAEALTDHPDALKSRYEDLEKRHGDVLGAAIEVSRELAVSRFEKRRDARIAEVRAKAAAVMRTDPLAAVAALLDLPVGMRHGEETVAWAGDVEKALAAVRTDTGMAYVVGGRAKIGAGESDTEFAPFLMDVFEVTNGAYAEFVAAKGARAPAHWGGDAPGAAIRDLPVVGVTAKEADAYAAWAGKRLPTALEWERAARGPAGWTYPWGEEFDAARCVARDAEPRSLAGAVTYAGGRSPDGLYHMAGNAAEWTADRAADPALAGCREVRGGSAKSHPSQCAAHVRYWIPEGTDDPDLLVGFRCVRDLK